MASSWETQQLLLTIFSFLGFFVSVVPLILRYPCEFSSIQPTVQAANSRLIAWNTGSVLYVTWTGIQCLNQFINLVVWRNNVRNVAPVWCEICELSIDMMVTQLTTSSQLSESDGLLSLALSARAC